MKKEQNDRADEHLARESWVLPTSQPKAAMPPVEPPRSAERAERRSEGNTPGRDG